MTRLLRLSGAIGLCAVALAGCKPSPAPAPPAVDSATAAPASLAAAVSEACTDVRTAVERMGATASTRPDSFPAFTGPAKLYGCVVDARGPLTEAQPMPLVATALPDSLGAAWQRDPALDADGAAETAYGLRKGPVLCLVRANWSATATDSLGGPAPNTAGSAYTASVGCTAS